MSKVNKAAEAAIPVERLREEFLYTPSTGRLIHRKAKGCGAAKVFALQPAGYVSRAGYLVIRIGKRGILAHRIAYAIFHGHWPEGEIDHRDRNRLNNAISNLRVATRTENNTNSGLRVNNTSGFKGVCWNKQLGMWEAQIKIGGKAKRLGYYDDLALAALVRRIAEHAYFGGIHTLRDPDEDSAQAA